MGRLICGFMGLLFGCMFFLLVNGVVFAAPTDFEFGMRAAVSIDDEGDDLTQYELFGALPLPLEKNFSSGWQMDSMLDLSVGVLEGDDETSGKFALGADFFFNAPKEPFSVTAGVGIGLMTEEEVGSEDFGGPVYFRFQVGFNYWLMKSFSVGYRFLHESNGSIYDKNPSLNMHQLELRMHF